MPVRVRHPPGGHALAAPVPEPPLVAHDPRPDPHRLPEQGDRPLPFPERVAGPRRRPHTRSTSPDSRTKPAPDPTAPPPDKAQSPETPPTPPPAPAPPPRPRHRQKPTQRLDRRRPPAAAASAWRPAQKAAPIRSQVSSSTSSDRVDRPDLLLASGTRCFDPTHTCVDPMRPSAGAQTCAQADLCTGRPHCRSAVMRQRGYDMINATQEHAALDSRISVAHPTVCIFCNGPESFDHPSVRRKGLEPSSAECVLGLATPCYRSFLRSGHRSTFTRAAVPAGIARLRAR